MKRITWLCAIIALFSTTLLAQAPQAIKYQAVARDAQGNILANQSVGVQISIIDSAAVGATVYQETFATTTNANGLFLVNIGMGNATTGIFSAIDWATGNKWMQLDLDATGGTNYATIGMFELLSVPYALYANTAGTSSTSILNSTNNQTVPIYNSTSRTLDCSQITDNGAVVGISQPQPTSNTSFKLDVNGGVLCTGLLTSSDKRYKENILPIANAAEKLSKITGYYYDFKTIAGRNFPKQRQIGFIAQELEKVVPEVVFTDAKGYKAVAYQNMTALLVQGFREQQAQIDELKKELSEIKVLLEAKNH